MRLASRLRASRIAGAAGVLGASLILAPPPAVADRDDWDDRGRWHRRDRDFGWHDDHPDYGGHRGKHYRKHHDRHHVHGDWCEPRRSRGYYAYRPAPVWYVPPRPYRGRYYCDPCAHWYYDEHAFHRHVHHHHHVPAAVVPLVILATVFGAVFSGY